LFYEQNVGEQSKQLSQKLTFKTSLYKGNKSKAKSDSYSHKKELKNEK